MPAPLAFLRAVPADLIPGLALATVTCLLLAGCSPGTVENPMLFPTIHDTPPPRAEAPMTPLELQKTTEDLISERDRLNAQVPQNAAGKGAANSAKDTVTGSVAAAKAATPKQRRAAAAPPATTASAQGVGVQAAGADPKP